MRDGLSRLECRSLMDRTVRLIGRARASASAAAYEMLYGRELAVIRDSQESVGEINMASWPVPVTLTPQAEAELAAPARVRVRDLEAGMAVRMYGTVVEITGEPYKDGLYTPEGWWRVPMIWGGIPCAPPEPGCGLVEVMPW